jgi:TatD DNase family protein
MTATFYDTHAHLDFPDFATEVSEVVSRAEAAGIKKIISIGIDLESSKRAVKLAEAYPNVYAAVGWHPSYALKAPEDLRPALRELAAHPKVVALGETGLDYYRLRKPNHGDSQKSELERTPEALAAENKRYKEKQADLFHQHLEVAAETGLNCVIHQRESWEDILAQFEPFAGRVRGVFHCFSESVAALERIMALNSLVSFTGIVTFKSGGNARDALAAAPLGKFMLETDSPFLAPTPYRGKRCEPAYVKEIAEAAAQIKKCTSEELSSATCQTAEGFFRGLKS